MRIELTNNYHIKDDGYGVELRCNLCDEQIAYWGDGADIIDMQIRKDQHRVSCLSKHEGREVSPQQ